MRKTILLTLLLILAITAIYYSGQIWIDSTSDKVTMEVQHGDPCE